MHKKIIFSVFFVFKNIVVGLVWFGIFVLLVGSSFRVIYKQWFSRAHVIWLYQSILCSLLPKIPFRLLSTQLTQSLFIKRKPELNIAGKRWAGDEGEAYKNMLMQSIQLSQNYLGMLYNLFELLPSKQSFALSMMLLGLDSVDLGFQNHHCNSLYGWYPRYNLLRKLRSTYNCQHITTDTRVECHSEVLEGNHASASNLRIW